MKPTKEELKQRVCEAIEAQLPRMQAFAESVMDEPELGFKEVKTSQKVQDAFNEMGITFETGHALTGVKATLKGGQSKYRVAVLGELDAIVCPQHPKADTHTGAAHCCGHNVQLATMLAIGRGFQVSGVLSELAGDLVLFAVPAEEYVEIDYRNGLRDKGSISYLGGKQQLIADGAFDDINMALQMHVYPRESDIGEVRLGTTSNGFIGKLVEYRGKAAHAAMAPENGINALNACLMGVMGVNAIRETFRDDDHIRFHPIINHGGDLVNVIPDLVTMESYVRAANVDAMVLANTQIDRALQGGAAALGAECIIRDLPGYLPMRADKTMNQLFIDNSAGIFPEGHVKLDEHSPGSTDTGDLSHVIPIIHPWVGCIDGVLHGANYNMVLWDAALVRTAQVMAMIIIDLLYDEGQVAQEVIDQFEPVFTKESYIEWMAHIEK